MKKHRKIKRFQECNIIEKIWRCRWYLLIPLWTIKMYLKSKRTEHPLKLEWAYSIAIGSAQVKMEWWYTVEETKHYLQHKVFMSSQNARHRKMNHNRYL